MPAEKTRLDSLREYLTGAASDGGTQTAQSASLGNFRSSTEAISYGITVASPISGISIIYASGGNNEGAGSLIAVDANTLAWKDSGTASYGTAQPISNGQTIILESSSSPGAYLRVSRTSSASLVGTATITLTKSVDNVFSGSDITPAQATAGITTYRATIIRNESVSIISSFVRFIGLLGTQQVTNSAQLPGSGAGSITTTGTYADWPLSGYAQIRDNTGILKEVIYYSSRTNTVLTVPAAGRALTGTTAVPGASTDIAWPVPNIAIAIDTAGVQAAGSSIQIIPSETIAPASVAWNLGIDEVGGVTVPSIAVGSQVGFWMRHFFPVNTQSLPSVQVAVQDVYNAP